MPSSNKSSDRCAAFCKAAEAFLESAKRSPYREEMCVSFRNAGDCFRKAATLDAGFDYHTKARDAHRLAES